MSFVSRGQTDTTCRCATPRPDDPDCHPIHPCPDDHVGKLGSRRGRTTRIGSRPHVAGCQRRHGWRYGKQSGQERPDGKQVGAFDCGVFRFNGVRAVAARAGDSLQHVLNMRESVGYGPHPTTRSSDCAQNAYRKECCKEYRTAPYTPDRLTAVHKNSGILTGVFFYSL